MKDKILILIKEQIQKARSWAPIDHKAGAFIALGLFFIFMGCMRYNNEKNWPQQKFSNQSENGESPNSNSGLNEPAPSHGQGGVPAVPSPVSSNVTEVEKQSLENMLGTLLHYGLKDKSLTDLVSELKKAGQKPFVTRNSNPDTGALYFVRTQSPLPGTRYFHAQYMSDEDGEIFAQHISFEFRPGPDSFNLAMQTLKSLYPKLGQPKRDEGNLIKSWPLEEGMHVYIQTLTKEEIASGHPYNAYVPEDEGTIRVAIEVDIHMEGHGH